MDEKYGLLVQIECATCGEMYLEGGVPPCDIEDDLCVDE